MIASGTFLSYLYCNKDTMLNILEILRQQNKDSSKSILQLKLVLIVTEIVGITFRKTAFEMRQACILMIKCTF